MSNKHKSNWEYNFFGNLRRGFLNPIKQFYSIDEYYKILFDCKNAKKSGYNHDYYMRVIKPNRTRSAKNSGIQLL